MINPFQKIIKYDEGDEFFDEFLERIHLIGIFKNLLTDFPEKEVFKGVVWFILWGYSVESEMLQTSGITWDKLSREIFNKTGLDEKYYEQIAELENDNVRESIDRWLIFQNDEEFKQYCVYRDLRKQFLNASLFPLPKKISIKKTVESDATLEIDADYTKMKSLIEAKMLAATNSNELLRMMNDSKEKFIQKHHNLKTSIGALNRMTQNKSTLSTEEMFAGR